MRHVLVYAVALLFAHNAVNVNAADTPQCRDENNVPVDWYVAYKFPKLKGHANPLISSGDGYLFITDQTVGQGWQLSTKKIGDVDSILGYTLAPLYNNIQDNSREILWALYNDDPPVTNSKWATGHAKGVVMVNNNQGFWLVHSVPKLAAVPSGVPFNFPPSGRANGQNFLCVSLGSDQFDTVGKQLAFNEIRTYAVNIPSALGEKYKILVNATDNRRIYDPPYNSTSIIKSLNSMQFVSFAKAKNWGGDLYDEYVSIKLQTNLYVQSWLNTGGPMPSICATRNVYNVVSGAYPPAGVNYTSSRDHSKYALSDNYSTHPDTINWVCAGDINRVESQRKRGGGALCFQELTVWKNFGHLVESIEFCPP